MEASEIAAAVVSMMELCLHTDEEVAAAEKDGIPEGTVMVEGVITGYGFHPERLESCRETLVEIIDMLPEGFNHDRGGGWSFLNLCETKDGELWTGFHKTCGEFFCLCKGLRLADYVMPREWWGKLPGSVPYIVFNRDGWPEGEMPMEKLAAARAAREASGGAT